MEKSSLREEMLFLKRLARVECLSNERPVMDGAALVVRISHEERACEAVVEVRLPGTINEWGKPEPSKHGRVLIFLQNVADEPVRLHAPEFVLTGGLRLPWKVGLMIMTNIWRGELAETLCWQVALTGDNELELLGSDVVGILRKGKMIVAGGAAKDE